MIVQHLVGRAWIDLAIQQLLHCLEMPAPCSLNKVGPDLSPEPSTHGFGRAQLMMERVLRITESRLALQSQKI